MFRLDATQSAFFTGRTKQKEKKHTHTHLVHYRATKPCRYTKRHIRVFREDYRTVPYRTVYVQHGGTNVRENHTTRDIRQCDFGHLQYHMQRKLSNAKSPLPSPALKECNTTQHVRLAIVWYRFLAQQKKKSPPPRNQSALHKTAWRKKQPGAIYGQKALNFFKKL